MEVFLQQLAFHSPYVVIWGVLLLSGFGLPIPEDLPLILAGYLCGIEPAYADPWIMFPGCYLAIIGADLVVFVLGRRYGHHVPRLPLLRRFLTESRLAKTEAKLHQHGGKFIFMARFLPGMRTAAFFTAGSFKIPYWKFLLFDGAAATLSVPVFLLLAYFFADRITQVHEWIAEGQLIAWAIVLVVIGCFVGIKLLLRKRIARPAAGDV